ncbi:DUF6766 family protein [Deinococcus peraridilitoris]|uniref:Transmembrane protein n=1 Tax=Deinococcus peraridilitoris (strain DSM 19664 / LMG 22246 / CIP 109416 / KR-200) TaxID=937777 RepID=L0A845_DEIPD|nr:DUF6766 family protein [Deinococcus peraridilitoris]AFZ69357.1 hypothetical protein Deipe_3951 [Deinococcus peraridilitoris DSM 19664]
MKRYWRENNLSIVMTIIFLLLWIGQSLAGWAELNTERQDHGGNPLTYAHYLGTAHFWEATTENWESEFLQMGAYVLLTVWLRQKGSSESKKVDEEEPVDEDPNTARSRPDAPGPVRQGGMILRLYQNSLSMAFFALFAVSFVLHAISSLKEHNQEASAHGSELQTLGEYLQSPTFWFQSLQNWQSEFLAVVSIVVLSIWLRQKGSPESKPVAAPHSSTGK